MMLLGYIFEMYLHLNSSGFLTSGFSLRAILRHVIFSLISITFILAKSILFGNDVQLDSSERLIFS